MTMTRSGDANIRILLVGYNGANNTGAEALLLADLEDVRAVFGPQARITVPTLNPENLRRYLSEQPRLHIAPISPLFLAPVVRQVARHDLVMLVEGSTYMDTWTSALLWYFLWAAWCARSFSKPCIAYAVDAGSLRPLNRCLVRHVASRTDQIVVRSSAAAERLRSWGVTAPIEHTADNAFTFVPRSDDRGLLARLWPDESRGIVGIAPVDFTLWPVVIRAWGAREHCYRWPYYFSRSASRAAESARLADAFAGLADWIIDRYDAPVALLCMEQLDEPIARAIHSRLRRRDQARVFSSRDYDASQMTEILGSLRCLVTSRFHAAVLSLRAAVPQLAVGHDLRLKTLYQDLGIASEFFLDTKVRDLESALKDRFSRLHDQTVAMSSALVRGHAVQATLASRNRSLLAEFARRRRLVSSHS